MICPQHDTHIDNCVHMLHNVSDNWEIRIPMRTNSEDITILAMKIKDVIDAHLAEAQPHRIGMIPVNISVQGKCDA